MKPYPNSIVDTLSINPTATRAPFIFGFSASTAVNVSGGNDISVGFAFKVSRPMSIKSVDFMVKQSQAAGDIKVRLWQGRGAPAASYLRWLPTRTAEQLAVADLDPRTTFPPPNRQWTALRFKFGTAYRLKADVPYVCMLDPEPGADGRGDYALAAIPEKDGYLSDIGTPGDDVEMGLITVRLLATKSGNNWTVWRTDNRWLARAIAE